MVSRKAAETAVKTPFYACVGLGELALNRASALPAEARAAVKSLPEEARSRVKSLQQVLSPTSVRTVADIYADQAGHALTHFAKRGEQVVARVRRAPETAATEAKADSAFDRAEASEPEAEPKAAATAAKPEASEPEAEPQATAAETESTATARKTARAATARKSTSRKKA